MNRSTVGLLLLAALGIGSLIGIGFAGSGDRNPDLPAAASISAFVSDGPTFRYIAPGDLEVQFDEFGAALPSTSGENVVSRDGDWRTESLTIELPMDGAIEYKAIMDQGDGIVYNWTTDKGDAYYDFHAHDEAFGDEFFTSYAEGEGDSQSGTIVAAYDGQHGWFWLNIADHPIAITLSVAGFYDEIIKIKVEGY